MAVYYVEPDAHGEISASRGAAVPSRHRRDSCPSDEVVGGFFFEFEPLRTASRDRVAAMASRRVHARRGRLDGVVTRPR